MLVEFLGNNPLQAILNERCDGNRNILHACATMCAPTSNKDGEQGKKIKEYFYCKIVITIYIIIIYVIYKKIA